MVWSFENIATSASATIEGVTRGSQNLEPRLQVAIRTLARFVALNFDIPGLEWDLCDEDVPELVENLAIGGLEDIRARIQALGGNQNGDEVLESISLAERFSEALSERLKPGGYGMSPAAGTQTSDSTLNALELLQEGIYICLQSLFAALVHQFDCCNRNHFARLKLTGFINQSNYQSEPIPDLYLSCGHDCKRSRWVNSSCSFRGYVSYLRVLYLLSVAN